MAASRTLRGEAPFVAPGPVVIRLGCNHVVVADREEPAMELAR